MINSREDPERSRGQGHEVRSDKEEMAGRGRGSAMTHHRRIHNERPAMRMMRTAATIKMTMTTMKWH